VIAVAELAATEEAILLHGTIGIAAVETLPLTTAPALKAGIVCVAVCMVDCHGENVNPPIVFVK